jgi:hypothetical protein
MAHLKAKRKTKEPSSTRELWKVDIVITDTLSVFAIWPKWEAIGALGI